jgi:glucosylceramidase
MLLKPKVYRTAQRTGDRLAEIPCPSEQGNYDASILISVNGSQEFQVMEGFGGAFTEAMACTLERIPSEKRRQVLRACFDREMGNGYTLCRTHINSCDFALGNYSYSETDGDYELSRFDMMRDKRSLIPLIRDALEISGYSFRLFASPWSPPAWMKSNGEMNHGGKLKESCREVWARYFCKYIKEMRRENIPMWGVTVQNEPEATQVWDSCRYSAEEERDFVRDFLGPALEREGLGDVRIIVWDHNKDLVYERAKVILGDPEAAKYVWGIGFHWYSGDHFEELAKTHEGFPSKKLLFTEGCQEGGVKLGSWALGERYGHDMIGDFNNWTVGFVDWNMVLNEQGGPNHVGNFCDAPIIVDTRTGDIHFQNAYYYIGHFSRFVPPGSVRVFSSCSDSRLEVVAFKTPDGKIVAVVMNRTEEDLAFNCVGVRGRWSLESLSHSIMTLVF